jgi:hypothetical protein
MVKMLPEKEINKFNQIYKKQFGKELDNGQASRKANNLFGLIKMLVGGTAKKTTERAIQIPSLPYDVIVTKDKETETMYFTFSNTKLPCLARLPEGKWRKVKPSPNIFLELPATKLSESELRGFIKEAKIVFPSLPL